MQYVLTEDEYKNLIPKIELTKRDNALDAARRKILSLTNFSCTHDPEGSNAGGYCDDCPCGMAANDWDGPWNTVCTLSKHYSK